MAASFVRERRAEYQAWIDMRRRCQNPKNAAYQWYGGRGIRVCSEWDVSFATFFDHVGPRPTQGHSLDRLDTDKDYEPGNVKWSTRIEQQNNKTSNRYVEYRDERMTVTQARIKAGVIKNKNVVFDRLRSGWDIKEAVETPFLGADSKFKPGPRNPRYKIGKNKIDGLEMTIEEAISHFGKVVSETTYYERIKKGWSPKRAASEPVNMRMRRSKK